MAPIAARQAAQVIENSTKVVAIELLTASQGLYLSGPLQPGTGVIQALEMVRRLVVPLDKDRPTTEDIESLTQLVKSGELLSSLGTEA